MTGFARVRRTILGNEVVLSLKSVNHRGLDLHFYMSADLDPFENPMRNAIKHSVLRGHVDIRVQLTPIEQGAATGADMEKVAAYVAAFRAASEKFGLSGEPDLNAALRIPGILESSRVAELPDDFGPPFLDLLQEALCALNEFRSREGAELGTLIRERNRLIGAAAERMAELRKGVLPAFQQRLRERLAEVLNGAAVDPQRLAQEAALLADRSDIGEEIDRLMIHSRQAEEMVTSGGEIGKKLDFLLQEMNRETNTILSKTAGVGEAALAIADLALEAKSEIEKIREQTLNLE
jgi:uncharacterized protein (TIGR00255 family)